MGDSIANVQSMLALLRVTLQKRKNVFVSHKVAVLETKIAAVINVIADGCTKQELMVL